MKYVFYVNIYFKHITKKVKLTKNILSPLNFILVTLIFGRGYKSDKISLIRYLKYRVFWIIFYPFNKGSFLSRRLVGSTNQAYSNGFYVRIRVRQRFFDQVGHQTTNASIGNEYFSLNNVIVRLLWPEPSKIGHIFSK